MDRIPKISRRARWAVPAGALAVTGAVIAGVLVPSAQASPVLPARTAAQLLAVVSGRTGTLPAFTGTVVEDANLGLPQLPGEDYATSLTSLLSGNHTVKIWYASPSHVRLAVPQSLTESDVILNGDSAWYWQSTTNSVTHVLLRGGQDATKPQLPASIALTPQQAARQAIAAAGPTTRVTTQTNITVAGEPAYQLVLAPKSVNSLIGQVRIAIDATHHVPLRVQIYPRHAVNPAFQVGFQSISFVRPAAANFDFTPPPGAKVSTEMLGPEDHSAMKAAATKAEPSTFGTSWLTVFELPASDLSGALRGMAGHSSARTATLKPGSSSQAAPVAASAAQAAAGTPGAGSNGLDTAGMLGLLAQSGKKVHGSWGSGELVRTSLLTVLMTSDGRIFLGAVTPSLLYTAAAHAKKPFQNHQNH